MNNDKKAGGIYAIEDEELAFEMISVQSGGDVCNSLDDFNKKLNEHLTLWNCRYIVSFSPGVYKFNLDNDTGCASVVDAARFHVNEILEGFDILVWDRKTNLAHWIDSNEYVYSSVRGLMDKSAESEESKMLDFIAEDLMNKLEFAQNNELVVELTIYGGLFSISEDFAKWISYPVEFTRDCRCARGIPKFLEDGTVILCYDDQAGSQFKSINLPIAKIADRRPCIIGVRYVD